MAEDWTKFPPVSTPTRAIRLPKATLIGILGPPGSGKTRTVLRLMRGAQRVFKGPAVLIDTEARRSSIYSPREGVAANPEDTIEPTYDFLRIDLDAPFRGDRCWAAIKSALSLSPAAIGFDNISDEHSGEGGYLDWHDQEVERVGGNDWGAWSRPSAARKKLYSGISHVVPPPILFFTFIAEEKTDQVEVEVEERGRIRKKKKVINKGWTPVAPLLLLKALDLTCILPWDSKGTPIWESRSLPYEDFIRKWPEHLTRLMTPGQITEAHGEALARWAKGEAVTTAPAPDRATVLSEIKSVLKQSFPRDSRLAFTEAFGVSMEVAKDKMPAAQLLAGLQTLKAKAMGQTTPQPEIIDPGPSGGSVDDTRSTAATIRDAAAAAGLPEERLRIICKGDPGEVPDSPEILEEILEKIRKETT